MKISNGMGAVPGTEGVTFRVWAPYADNVFVFGTFNDWNETSDPLEHEADGYWATLLKEPQPGDEYKYVIHNGDQKLVRNDPYAKKVTHSNGNSVIYQPEFQWEDKDFQIKPFNELVIYELHIGTFWQKNNEKVGDFFTASEKLGYLKDLGINAIELMPVAEFTGAKSWGYNPAHPFAIETDYGGPEGLCHFVNEAHKHGIAVIMDVVFNHFGPGDTDLWRFDGWYENGKGGIYFYNDFKSTTPWGENRPDYGRKEVRNYLRDNALMWLEDYHCDGLRYDGTAFIRFLKGGISTDRVEIEEGYQLLQMINGEIREKYPHKILIAEDLKSETIVSTPIKHNGLGFHTQWGTAFVHTLKRILLEIDDQRRSLQEVVEALLFIFNNDAFQRVIFTESHDSVANTSSRLPEEIQPGEAHGEYAKKKSTLGAITLFTAPGIPMVFQGQEFLMDSYFNIDHALDWGKLEAFNGIHDMYRDLIGLRNGHKDEMVGLTGNLTEVLHFNQDNLVIAYQRVHYDHQHKPVIIILNYSHQTHKGYRIGIPYDGSFQVRFNSGWKGYDESFAEVELVKIEAEGRSFEEKPYSILVDIPQYGGIILAR
ncbi:alpha-amylase family glycosyl hydrolase [Negadavirga shengliensis]|uniref:1,4-alpha-glucan branching enzyme n=1 Tax=Negadavirga shengliensis TaxID=1389218 RepID=A0ABV9T800_9BACT